jgi:hypothetical protein
MLLLSLIAALCGTPLRQAEAASDLARSLAEVGDQDILEPEDGGIGDDSGVTIKAGCESPAHVLPPSVVGLDPRPLPDSSSLWPNVCRRGPEFVSLTAGSDQGNASLQCFLF